MIGFRTTIFVGVLVGLITAGICGYQDYNHHIHHAGNHFFDTPLLVGERAAGLFLVSPLIYTVIYLLISGRITNGRIVGAWSVPISIAFGIAVTASILHRVMPGLQLQELQNHLQSALLPLALFLAVTAIVIYVTRLIPAFQTRSVYGLIIPWFNSKFTEIPTIPDSSPLSYGPVASGGGYISSTAS